MGCASSTPMIQTTGSEMLKAATHVASDATKTAEDAVQGVKDTVGKTLETAKDSVATAVEGVKHEVEDVVKEKTEMLEDAKNSLMEKLHLSEATKKTELNDEVVSKKETATDVASAPDEKVHEMDSTGMPTSIASEMEHVLTRTDTETDSLNTSMPEPEIEQALANSKHNDNHNNDDDEDTDNTTTPQPTLSELENLTAEVIQQHQQEQSAITPTMVNDISMNNDLLMTATHDNMKSTDITTAIESTTTATTTYNTSSSPHQTLSNTMHKKSTPPLLPLPIATTVIATATTQPRKETQAKEKPQPQQKSKKPKTIKRDEHVLNGISKNGNSSSDQNEEKRPRTTEWEKFADTLAQQRKYNPHDAFRRGGTLTKFGGSNPIGGGMPLRPSYMGHHMRGSGGVGDDDSSDTASNLRDSPHNSQRSSARAGGRIQHLPNRPNTGNQRKSHHEFSSINGGGPKLPTMARRNSNALSNGRKFDYNPARSRLNDYVSTVSSIPYSSQSSSLQPALSTQLPNAPYESVKSPAEMRSQHSHTRSRTPHHLEPLERPRSRSQQQHQTTHSEQQNGSSMPFKSSTQYHYIGTETLTRESSKTSLFSNSSNVEIGHSCKSSLDLRSLSINPPVRNSSSFLTTPRCSPFSVRKSYTDLYFSSTSNKENKNNFTTDMSSVAKLRHIKDKSPYKVRDRCEVCSKKYVIK